MFGPKFQSRAMFQPVTARARAYFILKQNIEYMKVESFALKGSIQFKIGKHYLTIKHFIFRYILITCPAYM